VVEAFIDKIGYRFAFLVRNIAACHGRSEKNTASVLGRGRLFPAKLEYVIMSFIIREVSEVGLSISF